MAKPFLLHSRTKGKTIINQLASIYNYLVNNPEEFEPVYLNMWIRNYKDPDYGYSLERCCECYNEDTHSHMPFDIFKAYANLYELYNNKNVKKDKSE